MRRYASRPGVALILEQELGEDLGAFARLSYKVASEEAFEFAKLNCSLAVGTRTAAAADSAPRTSSPRRWWRTAF